jgi:hypothetical protein
MTTRASCRFVPGFLGVLAFILCPLARAGELRISWNPSVDPRTTGYHVYVGSAPGQYTRLLDAGLDAKATIVDLDDDRKCFVVVKAHDETGAESASSAELVSLPRPRVGGVEPRSMRAGATTLVTITGSNIDESAIVRSGDPRFIVRSTTAAGPGVMIVEVLTLASPSGEIALDPTSFTVINPGRKSEAFFTAHPEAFDADGDHLVDQQDVRFVQDVFGATEGAGGYSLAADLDGNGVVDGNDLARVIARTSALPAATPSSPAPALRVTVPGTVR